MTKPKENAASFDGKEFVRTLTTSPGVYRMLDAHGEPLYVGKAGNLKKRVGSYFLKPRMEPRIAAMVAQIAHIEVTLTRTEGEALLLEAQLIKNLKPRYNILLRDDKSYPYIYLSGSEDFPRMAFHRGAKSGKGEYFGPYPSAWAVRESLDLMQKLFLVRQCEDSYFRNRSRPCLQYQIKRCSAPCVGLIAPAEYQDSVRHAGMFLKGKGGAVLTELGTGMEHASAALDFERAARLRDQIATLNRVQARSHIQGASADLDALACRIDGGMACVSVLYFRNGVSLGSRDFFPRLALEASESTVLASFIAQYYLDKPVPRELLLSHAPADSALLADALSSHANHAVEIKTSVRADRARFLELAQKNAQAALAARLASNQTTRERFGAAVLELGETPRRPVLRHQSQLGGRRLHPASYMGRRAGNQLCRFNIARHQWRRKLRIIQLRAPLKRYRRAGRDTRRSLIDGGEVSHADFDAGDLGRGCRGGVARVRTPRGPWTRSAAITAQLWPGRNQRPHSSRACATRRTLAIWPPPAPRKGARKSRRKSPGSVQSVARRCLHFGGWAVAAAISKSQESRVSPLVETTPYSG